MNYHEEIKKIVKEIKTQGYENVCFMHPAYNIGGGPLVETKMAEYLANNTDLNIYFCDYKDGYGEYLLKNCSKVKILEFKDNEIYFPLREKCILLTNSTRVTLIKKMHLESKIVFWHYETVPCAWNNVLIENETRKFLELVKKNKAMIYHDWSGRDSLSRISDIKFTNKDYLHITLDKKNKQTNGILINKNEINICFLSRLASDKIQSLYYLIDNVSSYKTDKKIKLHIIGDGLLKKQVLKFCSRYNNIEFIFTGTIARENLDDYLIGNADIVFGVGTCVLESSALKIPSAVLLMNNSKIYDTDAFWIFNSKEYCVGILTDEKTDFNIKYTNICKILDEIYKRNGKDLYGNKCYQYFIKNHNQYDKLAANFLSYLNKTTLTFKKLEKCIKYIPYNCHKIKVYKFLGIFIGKKIEFIGKTRFLLFGHIKLIKKIVSNNKITYYFCGIKIAQCIEKKTYNFPTAKFNDKNTYMKNISMIDNKRV